TPVQHVPSADGVVVTVHHLAPSDGNPPLLVAHASGFHARAYAPMAAALVGRFGVWGHDVRGHGTTVAPERWQVDWIGFGDDAFAVAEWLLDHHGQPEGSLVGFGHSLGGATLLLAALRHPGLFRSLVLYEPILYPEVGPEIDLDESPLV